MRRQRYLEKLEKFEEEYHFIKRHEMKDEVTQRVLFVFSPALCGHSCGCCCNVNQRHRDSC